VYWCSNNNEPVVAVFDGARAYCYTCKQDLDDGSGCHNFVVNIGRAWRDGKNANVVAERDAYLDRAERAERERDKANVRCRNAAVTLIQAIGACAPEDVEITALRMVERFEKAERERDDARADVARMAAALEGHRDAAQATLSRVRQWANTYGADLCPSGADTYGEGKRDAKRTIRSILNAQPTPPPDELRELAELVVKARVARGRLSPAATNSEVNDADSMLAYRIDKMDEWLRAHAQQPTPPASDPFDCCGGNDAELPHHHCSDCSEHPWSGEPDPRCMLAPEACPHKAPSEFAAAASPTWHLDIGFNAGGTDVLAQGRALIKAAYEAGLEAAAKICEQVVEDSDKAAAHGAHDCRRRIRAAKGGGEVMGDAKSDGTCAKSKDGRHCVHWWDEEDHPCCYCGSNAELDNEGDDDAGERRWEAK
jgi:hypothetical protein